MWGLQGRGRPGEWGTGGEGEGVRVRSGRYWPYAQRCKEARSLETGEQLVTISLEEAQALLAQPRQRRGRGVVAHGGSGHDPRLRMRLDDDLRTHQRAWKKAMLGG